MIGQINLDADGPLLTAAKALDTGLHTYVDEHVLPPAAAANADPAFPTFQNGPSWLARCGFDFSRAEVAEVLVAAAQELTPRLDCQGRARRQHRYRWRRDSKATSVMLHDA